MAFYWRGVGITAMSLLLEMLSRERLNAGPALGVNHVYGKKLMKYLVLTLKLSQMLPAFFEDLNMYVS